MQIGIQFERKIKKQSVWKNMEKVTLSQIEIRKSLEESNFVVFWYEQVCDVYHMTKEVQAVIGSIVVVSVLIHFALLHLACDMKNQCVMSPNSGTYAL